MSRYILGASRFEIKRLTSQAKLWDSMTQGLFDRLGVGPGWRCLDVGAGIGAVTIPLARRVGQKGGIDAIESAPSYTQEMRRRIHGAGVRNISLFQMDLRQFPVLERSYDLIFSRWVFSFLPDAEACLRWLVQGLKPGGVLAIEDYHHVGAAFYPNLPSFDKIFEAVRKWYRLGGGNARVAGDLPTLYRKLGLKRIEVIPHLRVGDAQSDLWKWIEVFFQGHLQEMTRAGALTPSLARQFRRDIAQARRIPGSLVVAPPIFDVIGRRG